MLVCIHLTVPLKDAAAAVGGLLGGAPWRWQQQQEAVKPADVVHSCTALLLQPPHMYQKWPLHHWEQLSWAASPLWCQSATAIR